MIAVDCRMCPLRGRPLFIPMTPEEVAFMTRFKAGEVQVPPGGTVLHEGESSPLLYTVLAGMGTRYKFLEDGRRQVISFVFPGDFIGLQAGLMGEMRHSVEASSPMVLCTFHRADLWRLFQDQPGRAYDLTWLAAVEEHFLGDTIATLGQRDATERVAWAFVRIYQRLRAVDLGRPGTVPLPFRQQDLADALGLSLVHTNKTLAKLRRLGLAEWGRGELRIPDLAPLSVLCSCDLERIETRPLL